MRGIWKRVTRDQAELDYQAMLESHPVMGMASPERIAAALEGKIKSSEPDHGWAVQLRKLHDVRKCFLSREERNLAHSQRMQLLEPHPHLGTAGFL